jgi:large subunit ribosomal protein L24
MTSHKILKMRLRRGDTVQVLAGRDRGKRGAITQVFPQLGLIVVEGVNVRIKHIKGRGAKHPGQRLTFNAPLPSGKVALVCPHTDKPTRIGYTFTQVEGSSPVKSRISRQANKPV